MVTKTNGKSSSPYQINTIIMCTVILQYPLVQLTQEWPHGLSEGRLNPSKREARYGWQCITNANIAPRKEFISGGGLACSDEDVNL